MTIHTRPAELLQTLLRFDTTNPPGNEVACVRYIDGLLQAAGIDTQLIAKDPSRPNLIARLPGAGLAPPLLIQGHVDVVPTTNQTWSQPPFAGHNLNGIIWGRGALDMKGAVAMMVCAFLRMKIEQIEPAGDLILCILSDEEAGGEFGARFLVEEHPELFDGVKYAIGEFGGFPMVIGGQKFYAIQVAEKLQCHVRITSRGPGGHGSQPIRGGAMGRMGTVLTTLDQQRLPIHITPVTQMMVEQLAANTRPPTSLVLKNLLNPRLTSGLLSALSSQLSIMEPLFRNTISPTIIGGGDKINVIPSELVLDLDARMLPGFTPDLLKGELLAILGDSVQIEMLAHDKPGPMQPDMGQFEMLATILHELDPAGIPLPYMLPAVSDGRFFSQLGIQTYGFTPLNLDPDFNFSATVHAADERVPASAIAFGTRAMGLALERYGRE